MGPPMRTYTRTIDPIKRPDVQSRDLVGSEGLLARLIPAANRRFSTPS